MYQSKFFIDIRFLQILLMGLLLLVGVLSFDFSLSWNQVALTFLAGLCSQFFWIKRLHLKYHSFLSAMVTCLGLTLLLRANNLWVHPVIAVLSISSKFLLQKNGQHFFNPSALGLVLALLIFPNTWISPGQWGSTFLIAAWIIAFGFLVSWRANRADISWLFLSFYLGGLFLRNLYLGYEIEIFLHAAANGSLLLFTFFMISDPKTSPDHFFGKVIQALFIALLSLYFHYYLYITNGFIFALVCSAFLVPKLNQWMKAKQFEWSLN